MSIEYNIFGTFIMSFSLSYKWMSIFKKITENVVILSVYLNVLQSTSFKSVRA